MQTTRVVVDTNVALDLLVFADARVERLRSALHRGEMIWLASTYMRDELVAVTSRLTVMRAHVDVAQVIDRFAAATTSLPDATTSQQVLRCRDPRDQPFVDFALTHRVGELISRDSDLLALARHALRLGLRIRQPS